MWATHAHMSVTVKRTTCSLAEGWWSIGLRTRLHGSPRGDIHVVGRDVSPEPIPTRAECMAIAILREHVLDDQHLRFVALDGEATQYV